MKERDKFLTVLEVAGYLQLTDRWIRKELRRGKMKGYKVSRKWRIREKDLLIYLEERRNI